MKFRLIIAVTATLVLLQGCASMSQQECAVSDWHAVGFEDGARGMAAEQVGEYRRACAKHGVVPDLAAYRAGRAEGLREFCQPQRGFDLGARGGQYNGACPVELNGPFSEAFGAGRHLFALRSNVHSTSRAIASRKTRLEALDDEATGIETELVGMEATVEERVQLLVELRAIAERRGQLEQEIVELERDRAVHEQELAAYESALLDYS